jgi:TPR repeat protein
MALLEKAAGQGHAYAMHELGSIHRRRKEYDQALGWYTKGAEAGLPQAMFNLGCSLDDGWGSNSTRGADVPAAADWYRRAADAPGGFGPAAVNLRSMYIVGRGRVCRLCLPRHPPHCRPSILKLHGITRQRGECRLPVPRARRHA